MSAVPQFPALARAAAAQRKTAIKRTFEAPTQQESAAADTATIPAHPMEAFGPQCERYASPSRPRVGFPAPSWDPLPEPCSAADTHPALPPNFAFYRKHTEALLRRYLYASMLVARAPSVLMEPLMRGWASYRPAETFEDCVIFVLDVERALARLSRRDRELLTRVVLQEYSIGEAALLLNLPHRIIYRRLADALDRLTAILLTNGTLQVPRSRELLPDDDGLDE